MISDKHSDSLHDASYWRLSITGGFGIVQVKDFKVPNQDYCSDREAERTELAFW